MKRNVSILALSTLIATGSGTVGLANNSFSTLVTQDNSTQLIAQSCRNTEIRLTNNQSKAFPKGTTWTTCNNYTLKFQNDGNLVLYSRSGTPLWATGTNAKGNVLAVQSDGNVVMYGSYWGQVLWATNTSGNPGSFLALQTDGNLVVYNRNGRPLWASNTAGGSSSTRSAASLWGANRPLFPLNTPLSTNSNCLFGRVCVGSAGTTHTGVDYMAGAGSTVKAMCDGVVQIARTPQTTPNIWDRFTIIKHTNCRGSGELYGYYGHINATVRVGATVKRGDIIGTVGDWGSNSHLHLGLATKYFLQGWGYQKGDLNQVGWLNPDMTFGWAFF
jgi:hypothetical protein